MTKNTFIYLLAGVIILFSFAHAAENIEEFRKEIAGVPTGVKAEGIVKTAFLNKNIEELKICLSTPETSTYFLEALSKQETSSFKDEVVLMVLREPSPFDKKGKNDTEAETRAYPLGVYLSTKYINERAGYDIYEIDNRRFIYDAAASPAQREVIARKFETIISPTSPTSSDRGKIEDRRSTGVVQEGSVEGRNLAAPSQNKSISSVFWISLGVAITILTLALLKLKKQNR